MRIRKLFAVIISAALILGTFSVGAFAGEAQGNASLEQKTVSAEAPISSAKTAISSVTLKNKALTYNGKARTQTVTVKANGKKLTLNKDYTVSYKNNKNVGTATVTVKGREVTPGLSARTSTSTRRS